MVTMTALLTFDELIGAKSLEELALLYDKKEYISGCKLRTIKQVRRDWKKEQKRLIQEAQQKRWPNDIPVLEVHTKHKIFTLIGVPEIDPNPLESNLLRTVITENLPQNQPILTSPEAKQWIIEGIPLASHHLQRYQARVKAFLEGSTIIYRNVYSQAKRIIANERPNTYLCTMLNMNPFAWSQSLPYAEFEYIQSKWFPSFTKEQQIAQYASTFAIIYAARKNIPKMTLALPFSQIPYVTYLLQHNIQETNASITAHEDVIQLIQKEKQYLKKVKKAEARITRAYYYGALTNLSPLLFTPALQNTILEHLPNINLHNL